MQALAAQMKGLNEFGLGNFKRKGGRPVIGPWPCSGSGCPSIFILTTDKTLASSEIKEFHIFPSDDLLPFSSGAKRLFPGICCSVAGPAVVATKVFFIHFLSLFLPFSP